MQIKTVSLTTAEAKRMAIAKDTLRAEQRAQRAGWKYLVHEVDDYDFGEVRCPKPEDEFEYKDDDDCEISAAAPLSNPRRFEAKLSFGCGRGGKNSPERCLNFGQVGYNKAHCPSIQNPPPFQNLAPGRRPITCELCIGRHGVRFCLIYQEFKSKMLEQSNTASLA